MGKKGDVIKASDGYARNLFISKEISSRKLLQMRYIYLNAKKENERKKKLAEIEAAQKLAAELKGKEVNIKAKAGENGRLFGAITK